MKKLFLAATFAFAGITAANAQTEQTAQGAQTEQTAQGAQTDQATQQATTTAQDAGNTQATTATADSASKTAIKLEELPAPVQESLKNEAYKDWTPSAAFLVKDEKAQKEYYQVDVKKGEETGSLKFDKDGKPVE